MHAAFNAIEAGVWSLIASVIAWRSWRATGRTRVVGATAAVAFAAFAVSDLIEIQTGAWYRPLWLLAWKAATVVVLAACYIVARRRALELRD
jgi:hypothetical protein